MCLGFCSGDGRVVVGGAGGGEAACMSTNLGWHSRGAEGVLEEGVLAPAFAEGLGKTRFYLEKQKGRTPPHRNPPHRNAYNN